MEESWWSNLLLAVLGFGVLLFATAVFALFWASRNGQLNNFEKGARTIFDEEEPEGLQIDYFPEDPRTAEIPKERRTKE